MIEAISKQPPRFGALTQLSLEVPVSVGRFSLLSATHFSSASPSLWSKRCLRWNIIVAKPISSATDTALVTARSSLDDELDHANPVHQGSVKQAEGTHWRDFNSSVLAKAMMAGSSISVDSRGAQTLVCMYAPH